MSKLLLALLLVVACGVENQKAPEDNKEKQPDAPPQPKLPPQTEARPWRQAQAQPKVRQVLPPCFAQMGQPMAWQTPVIGQQPAFSGQPSFLGPGSFVGQQPAFGPQTFAGQPPLLGQPVPCVQQPQQVQAVQPQQLLQAQPGVGAFTAAMMPPTSAIPQPVMPSQSGTPAAASPASDYDHDDETFPTDLVHCRVCKKRSYAESSAGCINTDCVTCHCLFVFDSLFVKRASNLTQWQHVFGSSFLRGTTARSGEKEEDKPRYTKATLLCPSARLPQWLQLF